jgi:hypothetical protein
MVPSSMPITHVAYADEASFNYGRVRGVSLVSAGSPDAAPLSAEVRALLDASGIGESKWEKVRSARRRLAAERTLAWTVEAALSGRLRVDVLTWDTGEGADSRPGLPYLTTLRRRYAYLVGTILPRRWPPGSAFALHPDEQTALDWQQLVAGMPHLASVEPRRSEDEPMIQVADLVAGLGVYSRGSFNVYQRWLCATPAERMADLRRATLPFSASDRVRCHLLDEFFTLSKYRRLGISLRTHGGLRTHGSERPICFWWNSG